MRPHRIAAAVGWIALALGAPAFAGTGSGSTRPDLVHVVLRPAQVGRGYVLEQRPDGHGVRGFVTMDLCGFTFTSERLRTSRLQVDYLRAGSALQLSNEVVSYRAGGAERALSEARTAARTCPKGPVESKVRGVGRLAYRVTFVNDSRLLPHSVALAITISGTVNGARRSASFLAVYQARKGVLSGVYAYGGPASARLRFGLHAAEESASNLETL